MPNSNSIKFKLGPVEIQKKLCQMVIRETRDCRHENDDQRKWGQMVIRNYKK